jgi:ATP-dependent Clp protease protease subunit
MTDPRSQFNYIADAHKDTPQSVLVPSVRDKDGTGYDIFSLILKNRLVVVQGQVEGVMAANIIAQIKYLESMDQKEPIKLLINSPGGSVMDGLAIVDLMREVKCPIVTIGTGMQASMGSILLAAGDMRKMTKNSQLLIHQIMGGAAGGTQHSDFEINAAHMAKLHEMLKSVYVEFTGLNHKFWDKVGERDTWFTAEQAVKLGFINDIVENEKGNGPYAADAVRPEADRSERERSALKEISEMSREKVAEVLGNGSANQGDWGRYRPELCVRLSEFPEYWTAKKCVEKGYDPVTLQPVKAVAAAPANDDAAKPAVKKSKVVSTGPK